MMMSMAFKKEKAVTVWRDDTSHNDVFCHTNIPVIDDLWVGRVRYEHFMVLIIVLAPKKSL